MRPAWLVALALASCGPESTREATVQTPREIPIGRIGHATTVPVRLGDAVTARFVLDTGIGLNLVSTSLSRRLGCTTEGEYRGRRMSGQELAVPLSRVPSLTLGDRTEKDVPVGVHDMRGLPPAFSDVEGFLSLVCFETTPFTIDERRGVLVLESETSLAAREARGTAVPVRVDRTSATLGLFLSMDVGAGEPAIVEVDTGSDALILDDRYMERLGIDPRGPGVATKRGRDETDHEFLRTYATLRAPIFPVGAPELAQAAAPVMFQSIIYDGLVGRSYLERFVVTYDVPRARMILARP